MMTPPCRIGSVADLLYIRGNRLHVVICTWLLALGFMTEPAGAAAQCTVNGQVSDADTGARIAGAYVTVVGTNIGATSDENGEFVLVNVPVGRREIRVAQAGYRVVTLGLNIQVGAATTGNIRLTRSVLRLDEAVMTGTAGQARWREVGNSIVQL